jgi:sarcosine oxidase subunit alpha
LKRLPKGGRIRRDRPLRFTWDGRELEGFEGDTLASALLASGVDVVGTSASFGRPRGITSAGLEEASGFAQILSGAASEPLVRMTRVTLYEGLAAESRIAKGYLAGDTDGGRFDKRYAHCDVLVVGAGPAGIAAALVASAAGARVMIVEADDEVGGALLRDAELLDGAPAWSWLDQSLSTLAAARETRVLTAATAVTMLDQNGVIVAERIACRLSPRARGGLCEQRLWNVRAKAIVLSTGALERPIVFQDNDRPGILLASGARAYLHRYALAPNRGLVFTTTDDGYRTALDWHAAGVEVAGVIDPRPQRRGELPQKAASAGIRVLRESMVETTFGDEAGRLRAVRVRTPSSAEEIETDLLAVSGGYEPFLDLHLQRRGPTEYDSSLGAPVPSSTLPGQWIAGAANGAMTLGDFSRKAPGRLGTRSRPWASPRRTGLPPAPRPLKRMLGRFCGACPRRTAPTETSRARSSTSSATARSLASSARSEPASGTSSTSSGTRSSAPASSRGEARRRTRRR